MVPSVFPVYHRLAAGSRQQVAASGDRPPGDIWGATTVSDLTGRRSPAFLASPSAGNPNGRVKDPQKIDVDAFHRPVMR
jgi:hypothetical protein